MNEKDVRATMALLGGSMASTAVAGPLTTVAPLRPIDPEQVKMRKASRSKTFARKDEKRNSALGFLSLFGRKTSEKTRSAVFHLSDDSLDDDTKSITASNPYLASIGLPYPMRPPVSKSSSSSSLLLTPTTPMSPFVPFVFFYALELSWADEVHEAAEMDDQVAPARYDDDDVDYNDQLGCAETGYSTTTPSSPEISPRKPSLFRRQGIRRKDTGSGKSIGKNRRFTHAGVVSTASQSGGSPPPDPAIGSVGQPLEAFNKKVLRGISAPVTSSAAETSSDSDGDDNPAAIASNAEDVVDHHRGENAINKTIPVAPCLIHRHMSQYIYNSIKQLFISFFLNHFLKNLSTSKLICNWF